MGVPRIATLVANTTCFIHYMYRSMRGAENECGTSRGGTDRVAPSARPARRTRAARPCGRDQPQPHFHPHWNRSNHGLPHTRRAGSREPPRRDRREMRRGGSASAQPPLVNPSPNPCGCFVTAMLPPRRRMHRLRHRCTGARSRRCRPGFPLALPKPATSSPNCPSRYESACSVRMPTSSRHR